MGIRQPSVLFQTGPARMPLLRAPMSTSTPPTLEGWIQFPCVDVCNSISPAHNPSSLKYSPLRQGSRVRRVSRAFQLFLSVSGQELEKRRGLLDPVPSEGGDWHRLLFAGPTVCPPSSAWRKESKASLGWPQEAGRVDGVKAGGRVAPPSEPVRLSTQEWK